MGVLAGSTPRQDVLAGDLTDAIFAADFGDLIAGNAPLVYSDPHTFFRNTYPTRQLVAVARAVFGRLANPNEAGASLRLLTGFGGGKSHSLMTLWHLATHVQDASIGHEVLPAAGRPSRVTVAAVDGHKPGTALFGDHGAVQTRSLWGELAWQLGGEEGWKRLREVDDPESQPSDTQFKAVLPPGPVLLLLDELVVYMATLSERGQGNLLAFLQKLMSICASRPQTVLVVSDPAGQAAYSRQAQRLGDTIDEEQRKLTAATQLDEVFARRMSDYDPIGDEAARVITRRLFERVDPAAAQHASQMYYALYERVNAAAPNSVPTAAATQEYARQIVECYPFHPRLVQTAQDRLGAMPDYQKSRGTLRLFARIVRSVWERGTDLELITAGDLDWLDPRVRGELLNRLNRDAFQAAVSADVEQHAGELDAAWSNTRGVHRRVASALLLESLPLGANAGLDATELSLATLRPDDAGPEPVEAMERLYGHCWHTYPLAGGRGWQFRVEPNVVKQIEERMATVPEEDARQTVLAVVQSYFNSPAFQLAAWPAAARQVSDSARLTLVLAERDDTARSVVTNIDDSDPGAPMPRRFGNAILAVAPTQATFYDAINRAQRLEAAKDIQREIPAGEEGRLVRDQLRKLMPDYERQMKQQAFRAFNLVIASSQRATLEEKYQVGEDALAQSGGQGGANLLRFLEVKGWIYKDTDTLDAEHFVRNILPGAVPDPDAPDVWTAKAVHERVLGAPGLRLIRNPALVSRTILRAVSAGLLVVRTEAGDAWDADGVVSGPEGARRRSARQLPASLQLTDAVLVTRAGSSSAAAWLAESEVGHTDTTGHTGPPLPPPPSGDPLRATTHSWEGALNHAAERNLLAVRLTARTPETANRLLAVGQPLNAIGLSLDVNVYGDIRGGGNVGFNADGVRPTGGIEPLRIAATLHRAIEAGSYEAILHLEFEPSGRMDAGGTFEQAAARDAEDPANRVQLEAVFGPKREGSS